MGQFGGWDMFTPVEMNTVSSQTNKDTGLFLEKKLNITQSRELSENAVILNEVIWMRRLW